MRRLLFAFAAVTLVGCAPSSELRVRSEEHAELAKTAYQNGDYKLARRETDKAQRYYDRSAVRAWQERVPVPPPPQTPPQFPIAQW